jgi:hypothetical protein
MISSSDGNNPGSVADRGHPASGSPYSAAVALALILPDGRRLPLGHVGRDHVVAHEPVALPEGPAIVEMVIDDEPQRWDVLMRPCGEPSRTIQIVDR